MRGSESAREKALTVAAVEQGVNHVLANSEVSRPVETSDESASYQPAQSSSSLDAQVRADDTLQIAVDADVQAMNNLICQHANQVFGELTTEAIASGKDVQAMALDKLRRYNLETQSQAEVGGYNGTSEATGIGVAHMARIIAIKFVLQDIRNSEASGMMDHQVRFCTAPLWESLAANSNALRETARARTANRSEAIRALQRSEVASDGL